MFNNSFFYLVLVGIFSGSVTSLSNEKSYPHWFFHIGHRESAKDTAVTIRSNNNATNHQDFFSLTSMILPTALQQDCVKSKTINESSIPLVNLGDSYYYFGNYFKGNFFKAMQFCRDHGMTLMSIESADENSRILNYLSENFKKVEHFWTSGSDLAEEGHFVWLATGKSFKYTYWSAPQPDNNGNNEHCLGIRRVSDKHYDWNDLPCGNEYYFICELPNCQELCKN